MLWIGHQSEQRWLMRTMRGTNRKRNINDSSFLSSPFHSEPQKSEELEEKTNQIEREKKKTGMAQLSRVQFFAV